jgi:hypothetical protein
MNFTWTNVSQPVAAGEDRSMRLIQWWLVVATGPEEDEVLERTRREERTWFSFCSLGPKI